MKPVITVELNDGTTTLFVEKGNATAEVIDALMAFEAEVLPHLKSGVIVPTGHVRIWRGVPLVVLEGRTTPPYPESVGAAYRELEQVAYLPYELPDHLRHLPADESLLSRIEDLEAGLDDLDDATADFLTHLAQRVGALEANQRAAPPLNPESEGARFVPLESDAGRAFASGAQWSKEQLARAKNAEMSRFVHNMPLRGTMTVDPAGVHVIRAEPNTTPGIGKFA